MLMDSGGRILQCLILTYLLLGCVTMEMPVSLRASFQNDCKNEPRKHRSGLWSLKKPYSGLSWYHVQDMASKLPIYKKGIGGLNR